MLLKIIKTSTKEGTSADLSRSAFSDLGKEINFLNKRFRKNTKGRLIQFDSTQRFPFFFLIQKNPKQNKTKNCGHKVSGRLCSHDLNER